MSVRILVAGASGLVGSAIVKLLVERGHSPQLLVRRPTGIAGAEDILFDYEASDAQGLVPEADVIFCALGTTRKKAGSDEAFVRVDRDYPLLLLEAAKRFASPPVFALVSSVGADSGQGLYLRTKKQLEDAIFESGLPYVIARPSFLVGDRRESRLGETIGLATLGPVLRGLGALSSSMKRYAPIHADQVAAALVNSTSRLPAPREILEGSELFARATSG